MLLYTGSGHADRQKERQTQRNREREIDRSNSKTLILKDSSVRSIWTYLTASPRERGGEIVSNLMFYAQSTSTVISG